MSLSLLFILGAVVSFLVALLIALAVFTGSNPQAWLDGGLLSLALSFFPWGKVSP